MKKFLKVSLVIGTILTMQSALTVSSPAETKIKPNLIKTEAENNTSQKFTFNFTNTFDYAACLDVILLKYEERNAELENVFKNDCATNVLNTFGNNLSKENALKLVKSADIYATKGLESPLYPTLGLRRRIAINLGYVYDTDKNNPDILKYVAE